MANPSVELLIRSVRGHKVMLDADLARLYGVPTKNLNQAVKRNGDRFPEDFRFRLTAAEIAELASRVVVSRHEGARVKGVSQNRSQTVTGSQKHRDPRFRPWVVTEHGAIMAATVLNNPQAVTMSVYVVRAFIRMREQLAVNAAIVKRLAEIDRTLLQHDSALRDIYRKLLPLLQPPPDPPKRRIGFISSE
jgi:hypothetical protein